MKAEKRQMTLHLTDGTSRSVSVTQPELEEFVAWMDLNDPKLVGPLTTDGVTYARSEIEAFSLVTT